MLYRVVRMVFQENHIDDFVSVFYQKKQFIQAFPGCISVDLMKDERDSLALATWSLWETQEDLDNYRHSPLFLDTWELVKPMFAEKAKAWSYTKHRADV